MIYFHISNMRTMLIGLTGTPGSGKTTSSDILIGRGYDIKDLNQIAKEHQCVVDYDKERDSREIDTEKLNRAFLREFSGKNCIIEGHLSHLLSVDMVIILRCDPLILKKRLEDKGWSQSKVKENVEAEILDVIKIEAHEEGHEIYEIDNIIKGNYKGPKIDWLKKYEYLHFDLS